MRGHHPQATGNATCDTASQSEDELPFAMPVVWYLRFVLRNVHAHGNYRGEDVIHIQIEPWVAKRLSHG
jgi:hypothetical protein